MCPIKRPMARCQRRMEPSILIKSLRELSYNLRKREVGDTLKASPRLIWHCRWTSTGTYQPLLGAYSSLSHSAVRYSQPRPKLSILHVIIFRVPLSYPLLSLGLYTFGYLLKCQPRISPSQPDVVDPCIHFINPSTGRQHNSPTCFIYFICCPLKRWFFRTD